MDKYEVLTLTQLPLQFAEAAEGGGDELPIFALNVFQDVFPVQADGVGGENRAVQVGQEPETQERNAWFQGDVDLV